MRRSMAGGPSPTRRIRIHLQALVTTMISDERCADDGLPVALSAPSSVSSMFHVTALDPDVVLENALRTVERRVDARVEIFLLPALVRIACDDELVARHHEVDANAVMATVPLVLVRRIDRHVA